MVNFLLAECDEWWKKAFQKESHKSESGTNVYENPSDFGFATFGFIFELQHIPTSFWMLFLTPNEECQSMEGISKKWREIRSPMWNFRVWQSTSHFTNDYVYCANAANYSGIHYCKLLNVTPTDGNRCTEYELGGERAAEEDARRVVKQRHAQYQRPGAPRNEVVEAPRNVM